MLKIHTKKYHLPLLKPRPNHEALALNYGQYFCHCRFLFSLSLSKVHPELRSCPSQSVQTLKLFPSRHYLPPSKSNKFNVTYIVFSLVTAILCLGPTAQGKAMALITFFKGPFHILKGLQYMECMQSWFVCVEVLRPSQPNGGHVERSQFT